MKKIVILITAFAIIIGFFINKQFALAQSPTCGLPPVPTWTGNGITRIRDSASNLDYINLDWNDIPNTTFKVSYSIDGGNSFTTAVDIHPTSSLINTIRVPITSSVLVFVQSRPTAANCPIISAPLQGTSDPIPNNPPNCTGGITITGRQPEPGIIPIYNVNQGETVQLVANGITDPDGDVATTISNVLFRFKLTSSPAGSQCPTTGDNSELGNGIKTFQNGNVVWTLNFNSTGKAAGTYYVWANPSDGDLYCTGNPFASSSNNYCGAPAECDNCSAQIAIRIVATPTPTNPPINTPIPTNIDPCPKGSLGNLNCDPKGCINSLDADIFKNEYFGKPKPATVPSNRYNPNLYNDESGVIDTADYEVLRQNYNNACI